MLCRAKSACISKGVLLRFKCSPFTFQKESFYIPKVALLQCKRTTFLRQTSYNSVFLSNFAHYERKQVISEQQAVCRAVHSHHLNFLIITEFCYGHSLYFPKFVAEKAPLNLSPTILFTVKVQLGL